MITEIVLGDIIRHIKDRVPRPLADQRRLIRALYHKLILLTYR